MANLEKRIEKAGKYAFKTEMGQWYNPNKMISELEDLTITKKIKKFTETTKEFYQFYKSETKEKYFMDDVITSVSAQLFWVNWLQIGIQKLAGINQEAVDNNFILTTISGIVLGYTYSMYRDFKTQKNNRNVKKELKTIEKPKIKNLFKKKEEINYWKHFPKRSTIKRTLTEGSFLATWHLAESMTRYRLLGETNSDKLLYVGAIFSMYGFVAGNIYAYTIDLLRHVMKIDKSKKDIDNIFEKYHETPIRYIPKSNALKRVAIITAAIGSTYLSYLAKEKPSKKKEEFKIEYQNNFQNTTLPNNTFFLK